MKGVSCRWEKKQNRYQKGYSQQMSENTKQRTARFKAQDVTRIVENTRKNLLSNITFELLTPLADIRSFAELLQDDMIKDDATRHAYYQHIISETKHLEQKIFDLAELSKLQTRGISLNKKIVRTEDIWGPVLERYLYRYIDAETNLNLDQLDISNIPHLKTDPEKLVRLINILMDYSLKTAGNTGTVSILSKPGPEYITFCIQITGAIMPEADLATLFDIFYEEKTVYSSNINGLEFAIAGQIVKALQEKIWVETSNDSGASFYFTVACEKPAHLLD